MVNSRTILWRGLTLAFIVIFLFLCLVIFTEDLTLPKVKIVPDQYKTVGEALRHADSGDIIYVKSGVYRESIVIDKPIILISEKYGNVVLDGGGSEYTVIIKSSNVVIIGFTISGGGIMYGVAGRGAGLEIRNSSNVIIVDNYFTKNRMALYVHSAQGVLISGNTFHGNREGIYLTKSSEIIILHNNFIDNPAFGIHMYTSKSNRIEKNKIIGSFYSIYLYNGSDRNEILENSIEGGIMLIINSSLNIVRDNTIIGKGLFISSSNKNTIISNSINYKPLIYLENVDGEIVNEAGQVILVNCSNVILRNLNISRVGVGVELWGTDNITLLQNSLTENDIAVYIQYSNNVKVTRSIISLNNVGAFISSSSENKLYNNIIEYNMYGVILRESSDNIITNNTISHNSNYGILLIESPANDVYENNFLSNFRDVYHISGEK